MESTAVLRAYFLPYIAPSHIFPLVDIAKLFASRGVHVTILITYHNSLLFHDQLLKLPFKIHLHIIDFPSKEVGLPSGIENYTSATADMAGQVFRAFFMLQKPMEDAIRTAKPDFIVADMHFFWASGLANELKIPRLIFHGQAYFALSADDAISRYAPHKEVKSDIELFTLPGLPDSIQMAKSELAEWIQSWSLYSEFVKKIEEGDRKSFGVLVNSFYELEKDYADHYRNRLGRLAWCIGPLSLHCSNIIDDKGNEGGQRHPCLDWLDQMQPESVVYVNFGSISCFSSAQLLELAVALESSGHPFIWGVRKEKSEEEKWLPEGFEERVKNKGLVIRGWVPQVMILEHPAVGGFVTHCGWNSVLESVTAGVPMVTWPLSAEHFYNEKLVTRVLKIGVEVGAKKWTKMILESDDILDSTKIQIAVQELMGEDGMAKERRAKVKEIGKQAKKAVEAGGSSRNNLVSLIDKLQSIKGEKPLD